MRCCRQRKNPLKPSPFQRIFGRSGEAQTRGLRIPNAARYQLRYTPIVIKLWSCKWSNLWSNTFLTAFFHFPNRPKYARLKGFRRFSLSCGANTVYAPKAGALPTALHPVIFNHTIFVFCVKSPKPIFIAGAFKHSVPPPALLKSFVAVLTPRPNYAYKYTIISELCQVRRYEAA